MIGGQNWWNNHFNFYYTIKHFHRDYKASRNKEDNTKWDDKYKIEVTKPTKSKQNKGDLNNRNNKCHDKQKSKAK